MERRQQKAEGCLTLHPYGTGPGGERPRPSTASELPGILGTHQPEDQTEPLPLLKHLWIGVLGFLVELLRNQTNKPNGIRTVRISN